MMYTLHYILHSVMPQWWILCIILFSPSCHYDEYSALSLHSFLVPWWILCIILCTPSCYGDEYSALNSAVSPLFHDVYSAFYSAFRHGTMMYTLHYALHSVMAPWCILCIVLCTPSCHYDVYSELYFVLRHATITYTLHWSYSITSLRPGHVLYRHLCLRYQTNDISTFPINKQLICYRHFIQTSAGYWYLSR